MSIGTGLETWNSSRTLKTKDPKATLVVSSELAETQIAQQNLSSHLCIHVSHITRMSLYLPVYATSAVNYDAILRISNSQNPLLALPSPGRCPHAARCSVPTGPAPVLLMGECGGVSVCQRDRYNSTIKTCYMLYVINT